MPKLTATATTTHTLTIKPAVKKKLLTALRLDAELGAQAKALKLARVKNNKTVEDIQVELGETHIDIEGFKSTLVAPMRLSKNWKKKYVALGGDLEILQNAQDQSKVPGKTYVKITAPGEKDDEDDDE